MLPIVKFLPEFEFRSAVNIEICSIIVELTWVGFLPLRHMDVVSVRMLQHYSGAYLWGVSLNVNLGQLSVLKCCCIIVMLTCVGFLPECECRSVARFNNLYHCIGADLCLIFSQMTR